MAHRRHSAAEMLKNIPSETAQQMLNAVRYQTDPPGSTKVPELDTHILGSLESVPSMESSLNRGDVVEIQGPAACGKTQLLYHLAANCILPSDILVSKEKFHADRTVHLGGWKKSAVVFDCDGRWDMRRLHELLITRLEVAFANAPLPLLQHRAESLISSLALKSLSRLHLFRPTSSFQLAGTLLNLPKYHAEQMPDEEVGLIFVDSVSSFYWADRWQAEPSVPKKPLRSNPLGHVLRSLQAFRLSHGPVAILTNWGLNPLPSVASFSSSASPAPFFKQHLPSPYPAPLDETARQLLPGGGYLLPLTCHITIPFTFVSPLQSLGELTGHGGGGLVEALQDERRKEVVGRGELGAYVRIPRAAGGQDIPPRRVVGRFKLRVLERDVVAAPTF